MGKYHPARSDEEALRLVRAALDVRNAAIKVVADMKGQPNAPRYGMITSPPPLRRRPGTASGLSLCFDSGVPIDIASEWGAIQIAESCTEATASQTREILRRLVDAGVKMDFGDDDPNTTLMLFAKILSVGEAQLPVCEYRFNGVFPRFTPAVQCFHAACVEACRRR